MTMAGPKGGPTLCLFTHMQIQSEPVVRRTKMMGELTDSTPAVTLQAGIATADNLSQHNPQET